MKIVILGYIVRGPLGGLCWHYLQYIIGLKQLGHEVLYLEDSDNFPGCYNPKKFQTTKDPSYGLTFIRRLFKIRGLEQNWAYFDAHTNTWHGLSYKKVYEFCAQSDIALNISNVNPLRKWWSDIPKRILIDTDPAFTQIRHLQESNYRAIAEAHTNFFSFGENYGRPGCTIPRDDFDWKPTRQPIVLNLWKVTQPCHDAVWTTIMQWDSYKERRIKGIIYGMKSTSFQPYINLPKYTDETLELAIGGATAPLEKLTTRGWLVADPLFITRSAESYQEYIYNSKGEFSIAKEGYVKSKSGWFSERSAVYLASGRPVVTQETGFTRNLPTGKGLLAFKSPSEALDCIEKINTDYKNHCNWARDLAEEFFNSEKVLNNLLSSI